MDLGGLGVVGAFYGAVLRGVLCLLSVGEERGGRLETLDDAARIIVLTDGFQEAHGLGGSQANHQRVDGGDQADGKRPAPAVWPGEQRKYR